ncbi:MAG: PEPxxWA-CTERM sorting domain-containing protein [Thiobacillus sp.]|nr:PEPxxWA-CTERM sorting domain-containing protein [Thiobacillus sp.]
MKRVNNVKQVGVRQSLLLAGLVLAGLATSYTALAAPAIVGSWHIDSPDFQGVATFMEDGTYFEAVDVAGDSVHTGVEWGTYSWNGITGEVSATSLGDYNGNWGLASDVDGPQYMSILGNVLTMTQPGCSGDCGGVAERILHPAGSIVGTWVFPPDVGSITFFADGSYIHGQEANAVGFSGVERGTYSWDSVTGVLIATSIITDTNGESGLSHPQGGIPLIVSLNANGGLTGVEGDSQFELVAGPVPEPETYAMLLAGLGLVGFAARRRAAH